MEEKRKIINNDFAYAYVIMIIVSFLGWLFENALKFISTGEINNRYMLLPFIAPYGLAVLAMYLFLGKTNSIRLFGYKIFKEENKKNSIYSNILYFIIACVGAFIGELLVGNLFHYLAGVDLWDYSNHKLCVTKFTCLEFTLGFGLIMYLFMKFIFYPLLNFLKNHMSKKMALFIDYTIGIYILLDTIVMVLFTLINGIAPIHWRIKK